MCVCVCACMCVCVCVCVCVGVCGCVCVCVVSNGREWSLKSAALECFNGTKTEVMCVHMGTLSEYSMLTWVYMCGTHSRQQCLSLIVLFYLICTHTHGTHDRTLTRSLSHTQHTAHMITHSLALSLTHTPHTVRHGR